ncbi:hypothetical protein COB21_02535 [Candidatus Aerophobetes bacterium]|uniref:MOMP-like family protein n=1 Tax=Aerophobetes bacterium TaxID=2030807 RepID=A0A2A4X6V5_UNCAE|nr:MAG: hypothetical protein COB21_02535 [Candidatus Aerophobetes bacterium]
MPKFAFFTAFILCLLSPLSADLAEINPFDRNRPKTQKTAKTTKPSTTPTEKNKEQRPQRKAPLTYNAGPKVQGQHDCVVSAEFLYMRAATNGYIYTETGYVNPSTVTPSGTMDATDIEPSKGTAYSPPIIYKPGFRATLGSMLDHGGWDTQLSYLWLYSSATRSAKLIDNKQPFQVMQSSPIFAAITAHYGDYQPTKTKFKWKQRYQVADITLGRNFFTSRYLKLRPVVGVRGTLQKKEFELDYEFEEALISRDTPAPNYTTAPYKLTNKNTIKQWGAGPFAGLHSAWHFNDHFSIYGNFSAAELYFHQRSLLQQDITYIGSDTTGLADPQNYNYIAPLLEATLVDTRYKNVTLNPMFDCALGFRVESYFGNFNYHILFQAGWEAQYWPNQILMLKSSASTSAFATPTVDFSVQGLTAKLRMDF